MLNLARNLIDAKTVLSVIDDRRNIALSLSLFSSSEIQLFYIQFMIISSFRDKKFNFLQTLTNSKYCSNPKKSINDGSFYISYNKNFRYKFALGISRRINFLGC